MSLYLTVEVRHDPAHWASPPYQMLINWCSANGIPLETGWTLRVYDESPVRAELDVMDLDEQGEWIWPEGADEPSTHTVTYTCSSLPPLSGYIVRGGSTSP
ncbi:hypothetical protein MF672_038825 [Actinomadura sp. ATCC 31491]|uniref:Uncharacterized protein n=1 Tax=Actinomadura luzonensis TaxID=2805427 RepID=A0ABT0G5P7_9ACTN|nr:hypothetical protein [Actinomadura luzonensis]MCK2219708.1 hypothetical protein [Actinomadura luzonensis]